MFLETICVLGGEIQNKQGHEARMRFTAKHFGFEAPSLPDLSLLLPADLQGGKVKCRVLYHTAVEEISFERYVPKRITSLKLIEASVDYSFKWADRQVLNGLLAKKNDCDDILITRNGLVTDTSYSNVVLRKGKEYFTPKPPLLNGTKRQKLLREGVIGEKEIHRDSLCEYDALYLINALLDIEDGEGIPVGNILP